MVVVGTETGEISALFQKTVTVAGSGSSVWGGRERERLNESTSSLRELWKEPAGTLAFNKSHGGVRFENTQLTSTDVCKRESSRE